MAFVAHRTRPVLPANSTLRSGASVAAALRACRARRCDSAYHPPGRRQAVLTSSSASARRVALFGVEPARRRCRSKPPATSAAP